MNALAETRIEHETPRLHQQVTGNTIAVCRLDLQRLSDVIRFHGFHGSKDLSVTAMQ